MFSIQSTDAHEWAVEFKRLFPDSDQNLMLAWFATAIEAGRDAERRKQKGERDK